MNIRLKPRMTKNEVLFLEGLIDKPQSCILEWGCGGSTKFFLENPNVLTVTSIEADGSWISLVRQNLTPELNKKWTPIHKTLGELGKWSYPVDKHPRQDFIYYSHEPFGSCIETFDVVLIDGRFRVACAIEFAISWMVLNANLPEDSNMIFPKILVHDYTKRKSYKVLEDIFNLEKVVDSLAYFNGVKMEYLDLLPLSAQYCFDYR